MVSVKPPKPPQHALTGCRICLQELCLGGSLRDKVLKQMTMWNKARLIRHAHASTRQAIAPRAKHCVCQHRVIRGSAASGEVPGPQALYTYTEGLRWTAQITEGLAYLHGLNPTIIHRDLKLDNVLMTGEHG